MAKYGKLIEPSGHTDPHLPRFFCFGVSGLEQLDKPSVPSSTPMTPIVTPEVPVSPISGPIELDPASFNAVVVVVVVGDRDLNLLLFKSFIFQQNGPCQV